ncbi:MAG TPA: CocE/NonD family hydrolase [Gemmatimonadaceae bacterium]|nr:CocE/NonD family hydrolase [Gemmatimonadaceae bacterium]
MTLLTRGAFVRVSLAMVLGAAATACASAGARPAATPAAAPAIREEAITFRSGRDSLTGTLFLPPGAVRHPAVIMLHGSGGEDRSANRELALAFAADGIAAFTYDKRGTGASSGDWKKAGFTDLTADAANAAIAVRNRPDIDPNRLGVYGRGQSATMLPMVAERDASISFLIAVGPNGVAADSLDTWRYDPDAHWRSVNGAVYLAWGANDQRVPVQKSKDLITAALKRDTPREELTCVYPGADHAIAVAGHPAPDFVRDVTQWALVAVRLAAPPGGPYSAACR